jgi:hypothetical protein
VSPLCSRNARSFHRLWFRLRLSSDQSCHGVFFSLNLNLSLGQPMRREQWGTHPGHQSNVNEQAWKNHLWSLVAALLLELFEQPTGLAGSARNFFLLTITLRLNSSDCPSLPQLISSTVEISLSWPLRITLVHRPRSNLL